MHATIPKPRPARNRAYLVKVQCTRCARLDLPVLPTTRYIPVAHTTYARTGRSTTPVPCVDWQVTDIPVLQARVWEDDAWWDLADPDVDTRSYVWPDNVTPPRGEW
jgi:hypothetical protein